MLLLRPIRSPSMDTVDLGSFATSFLQRHDAVITAIVSVLTALVVASLVSRAFGRRSKRLAQAVTRGDLTPVAATRLQFLRRLTTTAIVVIGIVIALAQFDAFQSVAKGLLASGAIAAAVIGFAARQTLANAIAGVQLAITQPLRIGDIVTFEGLTGVVEDVKLNSTWLRTGDERRVVIPNERLVSGVLSNDSITSPHIRVEVSLWIPPHADADRALAVLADLTPDTSASIVETTPEGVRLVVGGATAAASERAKREAELRASGLRALRSGGLLASAPAD